MELTSLFKGGAKISQRKVVFHFSQPCSFEGNINMFWLLKKYWWKCLKYFPSGGSVFLVDLELLSFESYSIINSRYFIYIRSTWKISLWTINSKQLMFYSFHNECFIRHISRGGMRLFLMLFVLVHIGRNNKITFLCYCVRHTDIHIYSVVIHI